MKENCLEVLYPGLDRNLAFNRHTADQVEAMEIVLLKIVNRLARRGLIDAAQLADEITSPGGVDFDAGDGAHCQLRRWAINLRLAAKSAG